MDAEIVSIATEAKNSGEKAHEARLSTDIESQGLRSRRAVNDEKITTVEQWQDGQFPGFFAGTARKQTAIHAVPWYQRRECLLDGWTDACIWLAAGVECVATFKILYITRQYSITIMNFGAQLAVPAFVGVFNTVLLAIFIYATAPASGGHINTMNTNFHPPWYQVPNKTHAAKVVDPEQKMA
ncbi:unnamed protein product [Discula destructiva]